MIFEVKGSCKTAQDEWTRKWVPAILKYANSTAGKKVAAFIKEAEKDFIGVYMNVIFKW